MPFVEDKYPDYYGVFGNPVLHSRSPQLYNSLFQKEFINAYYTRILTWSGREVCELIRGLGLKGANITTPFKEDILPWVDRVSPDAEKIGAVNTIVNDNGYLFGYNTDEQGVTGSLKEAGVDIGSSRCLVAGLGGAGKAGALGLLNAGAEVIIANRSIDKAALYAKQIGCSFVSLDEAVKQPDLYDIIVLALPPGIFPFDAGKVPQKMIILDANYRPAEKFSDPTNYPCMMIRGDRWLLHQAVGAYRLFTGMHADIRIMEEGFKVALNPGKLSKGILRGDDGRIDGSLHADIVVDGRKLDEKQVNRILYEEKSRAFPGKG